jgi:hypothetical protein
MIPQNERVERLLASLTFAAWIIGGGVWALAIVAVWGPR